MTDLLSDPDDVGLLRALLRSLLAGLFVIPAMVGATGVLGLVVRLVLGDANAPGAGLPMLLTGLAVACLLLGGGIFAVRNRFVVSSERWPAISGFAIASMAAAVLYAAAGYALALLAASVSAIACVAAAGAAWLRL